MFTSASACRNSGYYLITAGLFIAFCLPSFWSFHGILKLEMSLRLLGIFIASSGFYYLGKADCLGRHLSANDSTCPTEQGNGSHG